MGVRVSPSAPISRRGWNQYTRRFQKTLGASPCGCESRRRDHFASVVGTADTANLKSAARHGRARAIRAGGTNFSASGGMHTRESQKLVGESPYRCESCLADHFGAVRSGLLRPETINNPLADFLPNPFPGSEGEATSLQTTSPCRARTQAAKTSARSSRERRLGRAPGGLRLFSPGIILSEAVIVRLLRIERLLCEAGVGSKPTRIRAVR